MPSLPRSLVHALLRHSETSPQKTLLLFEGQRLSYHTVAAHVRQVAASLRGWGLTRGERVALYLENSPGFVVSYLAVLWCGGVVVPVNTRYRETELRHMLHDSGARLGVTDTAGGAALERVRTETPTLEHVVHLEGDLGRDAAVWNRLAPAEGVPEPHVAADDLALIAYTSGTTGRSKGAMLTHGNFVSNSAAVTAAWGWTTGDHLLLTLPLFHIHGLGVGLHGTLLRGSSLTLMRTFDAETVYSTLLAGGVTMFFGVPTLYTRLLAVAKTRSERPHGLRLFVSGSAPLSPYTLAEVEQVMGLRILERYGMSETLMNLGNPLVGERKAGSVGVPFAGVEVRIAHPADGTPVAGGETGEIQLRGPNVTRGYWHNPQATAEAFSQDGWFKTGDLGFQDADGYVTLTGRTKELIISGGFNVYPREIEELLETHPEVAEAAVVGLPDADLGERVVAAVVARGAGVDTSALQHFCSARLASFKKPKEVHVLAELPRNALGKVQKHRLRELLMDASAGAV